MITTYGDGLTHDVSYEPHNMGRDWVTARCGAVILVRFFSTTPTCEACMAYKSGSQMNKDRRAASLEKTPICAYGQPTQGTKPVAGWHCIGCARAGLKAIRDFKAKVESGSYDAEGYTPSERRAKEKKERA